MAYTLYNTTVLTMFPTKEIKLFDLNIFIVSFCISYFITLIYNYFKKYDVKEYIKNLSDNEMHNIMVELSNKMIIIGWSTKKYIAKEVKELTGNDMTENIWKEMIQKQIKFYEEGDNILDKLLHTVVGIEIKETIMEPTLEEVLFTLSNSMLRKYAGVTSNLSKQELVNIIMENFKHNSNKVIETKLEKLEKQLS
jgi:hypothetical protein